MSLRGCTILKYIPLPDDGNTEYIRFIPNTLLRSNGANNLTKEIGSKAHI